MATKPTKIAPKQLGLILYEEFYAGNFGDIDPYWFKPRPKGHDLPDEDAVYKVLKRACKRLNEELECQKKSKKN